MDAEFWSKRLATLGLAETIKLSDELREQARSAHPDWPTALHREQDLAAHMRLARRFRDADKVLRR